MLPVENSGAPLALVPVTVAVPPLVPVTEIDPAAVPKVFERSHTPMPLPPPACVPVMAMLPVPAVVQTLLLRSTAAAVAAVARWEVTVMLPPLALMSRKRRLIGLLPEAVVVAAALIDRFSAPLVLVIVRWVPELALVVMRPSATRLSVAAPPAVLAMLPLMAMLPSCAPAPTVRIVTLLPLLSSVWMLLTLTSEPVALGVQMPPEKPPPVCVPVEIVTLYGSSSHRPPLETSTSMPSVFSAWPDVSMRPPAPPCGPPTDFRRPNTFATSVPQTTISPPSPRAVALASMPAEGATYAAVAFGEGPAPWKLPPTSTWPPPPAPRASSRAPSKTPTLSPSTRIVPPTPPASGALASSRPSTRATPVAGSAINSIVPRSWRTVLACTTPDELTTDSASPSSPRAVSTT